MTRTATTRTLRRKLALSTTLGVTLGVFATPAAAQSVVDVTDLPSVAAVTGDVTGNSGTAFTVNVSAARQVVNWTTFNVPNDTTANFVNSSAAATAVVLNRVTAVAAINTTTLAGTINAVNNLIPGNGLSAGQQGNGVEVWIANPNGIIMGATGNFNTQGFVATTRSFDATDITNFVAGAGALTLTAPGASPNAGITGAAGQIVTGGRVIAFIAPVIQLSAGTFDAGAGDVGFVTAADVTIANPGSPLGIVINAGTALDGATDNALQVGGSVTGGNVYFVASAQAGVNALLSVSAGATTASASNGIVVLGGGQGLSAGPITIGNVAGNSGDVAVETEGALTANGGGAVSLRGTTTIAATGALTTVGGGNVAIATLGAAVLTDDVTVAGGVTSSGAYTVAAGGDLVLGATSTTVTQQAAGVVDLVGATGTLTSLGTLTVNGDTNASGDAMSIRGAAGIDLMPTGAGNGNATLIVGDPAATAGGTLTFATDTNLSTFRTGNIRAGTVRQSIGGGAAAPVNRVSSIVTGDLTLSAANTIQSTTTLSTGAVSTGAGTTTLNGLGVTIGGTIGNIAGQTGGVTINSGVGAASLQGSNLAGPLSVTAGVGGVSFTDLGGAGAKTISSGAGISGTSIAGAGAVGLTAATTGPITITGTLGASGARIGALTINGGSLVTIGSTGATGTTAFLTSASIGQGPATANLTINGGTDHIGTFISTTTQGTTLGDVASGAAFQVSAGVAGASFGALSGAGSKTVTSGGSIGATSIRGAGTVALTGAVSAIEGVTVNGGIGDGTTAVASLTVNGGNAALGNVFATGAALLGQGAGLNSLTTGGVDVGSLTVDTSTILIGPGATFTGAVRARTGGVDVGSANGITFASTLDGTGALVVQAAAASSVTFGGAVGAIQPFTTLTSTGAATVRLNAAAVTTTGAQSYGGQLVLGADTTLTGTGATFTGGVQGNDGVRDHDLALNFTAAQTIAGGGLVGVRNLSTDTVAAAGTTALSGTIATSGTQTYNDAVLLNAGAVTVQSTGTGAAGDIAFNSTLAGPNALTVTTAGTLTFGGVVGGGGNALASIAAGGVGAVRIRGAAVTTTGAQSYAATTLNGTTGVTLVAGTTVSLTGLSGPRGLTVNAPGTTTIAGNNGAAVAFVTTDAVGTTVLSGRINATGDQTYNDAVTLAGNTILAGARSLFNAGLTGGGFDLTLNSSGAQQLGGGVTGVRNLVSDAAGTLAIIGNVTTTGAQTYNDATTLNVTATLAAGANAITFGGTLQSLNEAQALTTTSPTAFNGDVGGAAGGGVRLLSLSTGGATTIGGAGPRTIRTVNAQSYGGLLTLDTGAVLVGSGATFTGGIDGTGAHNDLTLTFTGATTLGPNSFANIGDFTVNGAGPLTLNGNLTTFDSQTYGTTLTLGAPVVLTSSSGGAITFGTIAGGGQALTVNTAGVTSFTTGAAGLASLTTDAGGSTSVAGAITTSGAQAFGDNVVLAANATFISTAGGAIGFGGTVTGPFALTTTTTGQTTFGGAVGATLAGGAADPALSPTSVTTTGTGIVRVNGGAITTAGAQSYAGLLQLGAATVLTGTAGSFTGGIDGNGSDLTFNFSGPTTLNGGSFSGVANFTSGGGGVTNLSGTIATTGSQTYNDAVTLIGATTLQGGAGGVRFASTVDGNQALIVTTSGQTRFDAAVGTTPLASLTVNGTGTILLNGGSIRTNGAQRYAGATTLGTDTLLATGGGDIGFASTVDGGVQLSVRTSLAGAPMAGAVSFGGAVGGGTALTGLAIRANAATAVGGNRVGTLAALVNTGGLTFADAAALTIGTVDGLTGVSTGAGAATIGAGGPLTLSADVVGNGVALTGVGVTQDAGIGVDAGAGTILIDGNDGALTLAGTLTTTNKGANAVGLFDATDAQLGTIQTGAGGTLTLGQAGDDELSGAVTQLAGATISAGVLAGAIGGAATLIEANAIGTLGAFSSTALTLRTTGALTVTGPVTTGAGPLTLQLDAGALSLQGDLTGGAVTFTVPGAITQNAVTSVITATTLTGSAGGGVSLLGANQVGTLLGFAATGGFAFNNAQALTIGADLTVMGALQLGATDLDFTGRTLTAGGAATLTATGALTGGTVVAGGNVTGTGATIALTGATVGAAPVGTLTLTATDGLSLGTGVAGQTIALTSTNGPLTATTLTAGTAGNTGSVTSISAISGGATSVGTATSNNGAVTVNGASASLTAGTATNGALSMTASGGALTLGTGTAGTTATLDATGTLTVTDGVTSGGDASLTATGATTVNAVESTAGAVLVRGGSVTLGSDLALVAARSRTTLTIQATAGDVSLTNAAAGGNAVLTATGAIGFGAIGTTATPIGGTATVTAGGAITGTSLVATGAASVTAGGAVQLGTLGGAGVIAQGGALAVATATSTGALTLRATGGDLTLGTGTAGGAATLEAQGTGSALTVSTGLTAASAGLTATGAATVGSVTTTAGAIGVQAALATVTNADARTTLNVTATAGDATVTTGRAGGDATIGASGAVTLGSLTSDGAIAATASGSALTLGTGTAAGTATLSAAGPLTITTSLTSGGRAATASTGATTIAAITSTAGAVGVTGASADVMGASAAGTLDVTTTAGALTLGTGTAGGAATLTAAGPLTVTTSLTSGGATTATATGATTIGAIRSTGGAVAVTGASAAVTTAQAATALDLTATTGNLTLGTGTAGGAATLRSAGTLGTTALTATGAAALTATGAATLGQTTSGAAVTVTAGSIAAGQTSAATTLTMTSGGALTLTGGEAGGNASFDANGTASLGQVIAGTASTIAIRALDAAITGTQRAGTVALVNRAPATVAFKLGDGASAGGFALGTVEVNSIEAGQLTVDGGTGNIEFGTLAFDADAGRTRVDVLSTGRIDVLGEVSGGGAARTFRFGGTTNATDRASVIRVVATASAGGRLMFETADLDLRGSRIGVGQAAGFLDPIGFGPGGSPLSAAAVGANFVGNPNSSLYNSTFGGALYTGSPVLLSARSLTVRFADYALFQNTGVPGQNTGVVLGSSAAPVTPALILQGPAPSANAFALFGSINGISDTGAAVLGSSVIQTSGVDIANTRINGCLAGSGAGCLSAVVSQPLLNVFDSSRLNVFRTADDLALPFDPVVGTNNEALFSGFGLIDSPVTATECSDDQTNPQCAQNNGEAK